MKTLSEVKDILESDVSNEEKKNLLSQFNEDNAKLFSFVVGDDVETKQNTLRSFISFISSDIDKTVCLEALKTIRLLCREPLGLEPLMEESSLSDILKLSLLGTDFSDDSTTLECGCEATKIVINITVQKKDNSDEFYGLLHNMKFTEYCIQALRKEDLYDGYYFPVVRLLLQLAGRNSNIKKYALKENLIPHIANIICTLSTRYAEREDLRLGLVDSLSLLFVVSQHLGPLDGPKDPTDDELQAYKKLIPVFQNFLTLPNDDPKTHVIVSGTIKSMISVPGALTDDWDHQSTLRDLLTYLKFILDSSIVELESAELTPVLLILTSISRAIAPARTIIKDALFPEWKEFEPQNNMMDPPRQMQEHDSYGYKILELMTCPNIGLYHYSGELMFSLCDEDADEFVRVVGIGKGAGILANRGLLNSFSSKIKNPAIHPPRVITEEDVKQWESIMERLERQNSRAGPPGGNSN